MTGVNNRKNTDSEHSWAMPSQSILFQKLPYIRDELLPQGISRVTDTLYFTSSEQRAEKTFLA